MTPGLPDTITCVVGADTDCQVNYTFEHGWGDYYDERGDKWYPEQPPRVTIHSVKIGASEILPALGPSDREHLKEQILDHVFSQLTI